jgi:hypothetical protein
MRRYSVRSQAGELGKVSKLTLVVLAGVNDRGEQLGTRESVGFYLGGMRRRVGVSECGGIATPAPR